MSGTPLSAYAGTSTILELDKQLRGFFAKWGPLEHVDDLVQDTWLSAGTFRGESSLRYFLFIVARRRLADWFRGRDRAERLTGSEDQILARVGPRGATSQGTKLDRLELWQAVDELPDVFRDVMVLSLTGMTHVEISERLGVPGNTVRSRLSRARGRLRLALGVDPDELQGD